MTASARYVKIVEWSDEDAAFVGQCPGIIGPCCHGADEVEVYRTLCQIVEDWIAIAQEEGKPLPPPTAGKDYVRIILSDAAAGYAAP
jgi:predicted RNase H-like HicB family nuclease